MIDDKPWILLANDLATPLTGKGEGQCDCACPDIGFSFNSSQLYSNAPLQQAQLHEQRLSADHTMLFNPKYDQGVVVLNEAARAIWNEFARPQHLPVAVTDNMTILQQMIKGGLLEPMGTAVQLRHGQPQLLSAWLHVTNECNLRCDYCYVSKTAESMSPETGFSAVDAIIRSTVNGRFKRIKLKFAGGEATLNLKLVFDLHAYAVEQAAAAGLELESVILSNGVALGERAITELEQRGIRVMISLDGLSETHDAQRKFKNGRGSFAWTSRTLDRLIAQGIKPFISITVTDRNVDGLPEVVSYVLERGLPFNLNFFRDNECAASFDDLHMQDDRLIAAMFRVFDVIEANLPDHSLLSSLVDRAQFDQPHDKTCGVGESYLVIDHHGHIAKCHMEIEKPITDVYAEDPLAVIRADQIGIQNVSVEEKEGCRDCEWKYWCTGGCPLLTYRATGRFDVKSPYCRVYKAIYPRLLRLEGLRLLKLVDKSFASIPA
jgi:uncharacterized protein